MIKKMIDETVFPKESKNVSVGSGIIQSSRYLITISSNAGCMDFGFIVGAKTLVKQGNLDILHQR